MDVRGGAPRLHRPEVARSAAANAASVVPARQPKEKSPHPDRWGLSGVNSDAKIAGALDQAPAATASLSGPWSGVPVSTGSAAFLGGDDTGRSAAPSPTTMVTS